MQAMTQAPAVTWDDLKAWLAAHGAPTETVRTISFVPASIHRGPGAAIHLRVEHYAIDANGQRFAVRNEAGVTEVATEVTWVPLHHLP